MLVFLDQLVRAKVRSENKTSGQEPADVPGAGGDC
jgi:hypothetical protein